MTLPKFLQGILHPKPKAEQFAAERAVVYAAFKAAHRRCDTRAMNAASASLQALTHAQLRAELGR